MKKQILTINLSDDRNNVFREYFLLDHLELDSCNEINDAITRLMKNTFCLIIFDSLKLDVDETQEIITRLRKVTYIPLLVITPQVSAASVLEIGADVCIPQDTDIHVVFALAMALIRRYTVYNHFDIFYLRRS